MTAPGCQPEWSEGPPQSPELEEFVLGFLLSMTFGGALRIGDPVTFAIVTMETAKSSCRIALILISIPKFSRPDDSGD